MNLGERIKALRAALDLTQEQVAERSGGRVKQGTLAKVERGDNKLSGSSTRDGLAAAFGLSGDDFRSYLDGSQTLGSVLARARGAGGGESPAPRAELRVEREDAHVPEDDEVPLETAALRVMDRERHTLRDLDAVRAAIRAAPRKEIRDADLGETALRLLDAARQLRLEGEAATPTALLWRAAVGRHARDAEVVDEISRAESEEVAASLRAKGYEPGQGKAALEARAAAAKAKKARRES